MANTVNLISNDIDVVNKFNTLLEVSLGENSVYIRAKDSLKQLVADGDISEAKKAEMLANVLGNVTGSITAACMQGAISWAKEEKDIELKKQELARQVDILEFDSQIKEHEVDATRAKSIQLQAQTIRTLGVPTVDANGTVLSLDNSGKEYETTRVLQQQLINDVKQGTLLDQKIKESYAAIHKVVADTYANFGSYTYTVSEDGLRNVVRGDTATGNVTQADLQKQIAAQQVNGYVYNMWSNVVTSTSAMVGTALTSDLPIFGPGETGGVLLGQIKDLTASMAAVRAPNTVTARTW